MTHPDAFRLLRYRCERCGGTERIWNSRSGWVLEVVDCAWLADPLALDRDHPGPRSVADAMALDVLHTSTVHRLRAMADPMSLPPLVACGGVARRERSADIEFPDYDPLPGERYFRDGTPAEAREIMRAELEQIVEHIEGQGHRPIHGTTTMSAHMKKIIDQAGNGELAEFAPGWPHLVVRGSDADMLPVREAKGR